jgi:hypothetical protein
VTTTRRPPGRQPSPASRTQSGASWGALRGSTGSAPRSNSRAAGGPASSAAGAPGLSSTDGVSLPWAARAPRMVSNRNRVQSGVQIERNRAQLNTTQTHGAEPSRAQKHGNPPAGGRAVAGSNPVSPIGTKGPQTRAFRASSAGPDFAPRGTNGEQTSGRAISASPGRMGSGREPVMAVGGLRAPSVLIEFDGSVERVASVIGVYTLVLAMALAPCSRSVPRQLPPWPWCGLPTRRRAASGDDSRRPASCAVGAAARRSIAEPRRRRSAARSSYGAGRP